MASTLVKNLSDYEANFDTEVYLNEIGTLNDTCIHTTFIRSFASMYHEVFSAHKPGHRLLDIGSGPSLWHVMSASAKYRYCISCKIVNVI